MEQKPTRFFFIDRYPPEVERTHLMKQGIQFLFELKNMQEAGVPKDVWSRYLRDGTKFKFNTFGPIDNIYITTTAGGESQDKKETTSVTVELVPIVELCKGSSAVAGFAAFNLGKGVGPDTIGEPEGWGSLIGITDKIGKADDEDVSCFNGEATSREGKCHIEVSLGNGKITVDELPRIDQGWLSYPTGTVLECEDNVWTYEDWGGATESIPAYKLWIHSMCFVNPGPPPEDICGYSWVMDPEHGEADHNYWSDGNEEYLFFGYGKPSVPPYIYWHPSEFNQEFEYAEQYNRTGWLRPDTADYPDGESWGDVPLEGDESCLEWFQHLVTRYHILRVWGLLTHWGNSWLPLHDSGRMAFPYTSPVNVPRMEDIVKTEDARIWMLNGVYPETKALDLAFAGSYIQAGYKMEKGWYESCEGWTIYKRVAINLATEFVHPDDLTERQRELCLGNEDAMNWPEPDIFTGLSSLSESWYTMAPCIATVLVSGDDYYVFTPQLINSEYGSVYKIHEQHYEKADAYDYGIFNSVMSRDWDSYSKLVHVYSFVTEENEPNRLSFGVIYEKLHYRSLWFEKSGDNGFSIPGIDDFLALPRIRVGLKTTVTTKVMEA